MAGPSHYLYNFYLRANYSTPKTLVKGALAKRLFFVYNICYSFLKNAKNFISLIKKEA